MLWKREQDKWIAEGRPLTTDAPAPGATDYPVVQRDDSALRAYKEDVLAHLGKPLVDVRSPGNAIVAGIGYLPEDRKQHGVVPEMAVEQNVSLANLAAIARGGLIDRPRERSLGVVALVGAGEAGQARLLDLLRGLAASLGLAAVIVTHDLAVARLLEVFLKIGLLERLESRVRVAEVVGRRAYRKVDFLFEVVERDINKDPPDRAVLERHVDDKRFLEFVSTRSPVFKARPLPRWAF